MNADGNPETRFSLIAKIRDMGDDDAWREFERIYQPVVQRFILRHGLQDADAAEISQEVLARVAKSIASWDGELKQSTFRGWLYRITQNLTIDFLRKKKIELARTSNENGALSQIVDTNPSVSGEFQREYEKELFHWAAQKLKPTFKATNWDAFWLSTIEGLPIEEVANRLNMECGAIYVARSRIMAKLSKLIHERLGDSENANEG